jgi:hypothetical protein
MKQEIPQIGTKEFNDLVSAYFGGKPKQETLEEAANKLLWKKYPYHPPKDAGYWKDMFSEGAKWQMERSYSEEEVVELFKQYKEYFGIYRNVQILNAEFNEWFEQNKKK